MHEYVWLSIHSVGRGGGPLPRKSAPWLIDEVYVNQSFGSNFRLRGDFLLKLGVWLSCMLALSFRPSLASVRSVSDRTVNIN